MVRVLATYVPWLHAKSSKLVFIGAFYRKFYMRTIDLQRDYFEKASNIPSGELDTLGDHTVSCPVEGDRVASHDRLHDKSFSTAASAKLSPVLEKANLITGVRERPGDVYLPSWRGGRPAVIGVTVTSFFQLDTSQRSAITPGIALTLAEKRKITAHDSQCSSHGMSSIPIAVEALGGKRTVALGE